MEAQVQGQFRNAFKWYPALQQVSPLVYRIAFSESPDLEFLITLTENFPREAPSVTCKSSPLSIPLIESWVKPFQLVDICHQLHVIAQLPPPQQFTVTQAELDAASASVDPAALQDPAVCRQLVAQLPTMVQSNAAVEQARSSRLACEEALRTNLEQAFVQSCASVAQLVQERRELMNRQASLTSPSRSNQAMSRKIAQLRGTADRAGERAAEIKSQFAGGAMTLDAFWSGFMAAVKEQSTDRALADFFERHAQ
jgi:hypothetical protein